MTQKQKKDLDRQSAFMGDYKAMLKLNPKQIDEKAFILACKRVNVNPYAVLNPRLTKSKRKLLRK